MRSTTKALSGLITAAALVLAGCGTSSTATGSTSSAAPSSGGATSGGATSGSATSGSGTGGECDTATSAGSASAGSSANSSAASSSGASSSAAALPSAGPTATGPIIVGSAAFPENVLLAEIYAGALEAKGIAVTKKLSIGQREAYYAGLKDGSIDLIPEYTGNLLGYVDKTATAETAEEIYAALPAVLAPDKLTVLDQSQAEDKDAMVVTKETAEKYSLKTITDLAKVACNLTFGGSIELQTRTDGIPGLKAKYGLTFGKYVELDSGGPLSINGLKNNQVDVSDIFTTDPSIPANDFVVLEDPENNFRAQLVVPLISAAKATDDVAAALNAVSAKLTTADLTESLGRVYNNEAADVVAKDWLTKAGLN